MSLRLLNKYLILILLFIFRAFPSIASEGLNYYMSNIGMNGVKGEAINFTLPNIDGKRMSLKDFRGRVIMLNFWATWCSPCRVEMPSMENLYKKFKDRNFIILGISVDNNRIRRLSNFIKEFGITFPVLLDKDGKIANRYGVKGIPTTFIINRNGEFIGKIVGARDWLNPNAVELIRYIIKGF
jgi:peroxiredoxin